MNKAVFKPLEGYTALDEEQMLQRSADFFAALNRRRTVREFSSRPVPREIIDWCLRAAGTAPSGANMQPWHFAVVGDPAIKSRIRVAAENEEQHFYQHRAPQEWLDALAPLGTDSNKPFLERAPFLIAVFAQKYGTLPDGRKVKHYYPTESVGLATGMLIAALHLCGLASLTHTPSPMKFLNEILGRPRNERAFLLLVVGYPDKDALVPDIGRKELGEFVSYHE